MQTLLREGCQIAAYDPAAQERAREVLNSSVEYASDAYEAARGADALLILTEWDEFASLWTGNRNQDVSGISCGQHSAHAFSGAIDNDREAEVPVQISDRRPVF